jgi:UDP-glucose 4-epimerase
MSHYLVTGGAGFIGSHLVERLLAGDDRVTVVDNFSSGQRQNLPSDSRLSVIAEDVLLLRPEQLGSSFDGLVHLAALPSVNSSWIEPAATHAANLTATLQMIELARQLRVRRMVFASSAAVYGDAATFPIAESHPCHPLSPYGLQKLASEEYGRLFADEDFSFVALRLFNVFGARQVADSPYSGVITRFATALGANQPVTIFGEGRQTRDFVYVKDIAEGMANALVASLPTPVMVCNLGRGRAISILELFAAMRPFFPDWAGDLQHRPARAGDIARSEADISKAQELLGFHPRFSFELGLANMLA